MESVVIASDLVGYIPHAAIERLKRSDQQARARREQVLSVPSYFARGPIWMISIIISGKLSSYEMPYH